MKKNTNNAIVYIHDKNRKKWDALKNKSAFVNWALENTQVQKLFIKQRGRDEQV